MSSIAPLIFSFTAPEPSATETPLRVDVNGGGTHSVHVPVPSSNTRKRPLAESSPPQSPMDSPIKKQKNALGFHAAMRLCDVEELAKYLEDKDYLKTVGFSKGSVLTHVLNLDANENKIKVIELFLKAWPELISFPHETQLPIEIARKRAADEPEVFAFLVKKDFANATLKECLDHPDIETLSNYIRRHPKSLETVLPEGLTPISYLLKNSLPNDLSVFAKIQNLLAQKKDLLFKVPPQLKSGWNALMFASAAGHASAVKLFIELDPDKKLVKANSKNGQKALGLAITNGHKQCIEFLIAAEPKMLGQRTADCHLDSVLELASKSKAPDAPGIRKLLDEKIAENKIKIPSKVPKRKVTKEEVLQNLDANLEEEKKEIESLRASITKFMKNRTRLQNAKFQELDKCEEENKKLLEELASLLSPEPAPSSAGEEGDESIENVAERDPSGTSNGDIPDRIVRHRRIT